MAHKFYTKEPKVQKTTCKTENNHSQDNIDLPAIKYNLSISPSQRLYQHQSSLITVIELRKAHKELYAKPKSTP